MFQGSGLCAATVACIQYHRAALQAPASDATAASSPSQSQLVFLGTGSSTGCPKPRCAAFPPDTDKKWLPQSCPVSWMALEGDPANNPNYRNNPSVLVRHFSEEKGRHLNVVIDVGKTFRESVLRWLPRLSPAVEVIDSVILTHEHADAMMGLDDLRGMQDPWNMVPIPIFLSSECLKVVSRAFPYLMPKKPQPGAERRFVAALNFRTVQHFEPFFPVGGKLPVTPLPLVHGEDCICLGFAFGERDRVVYLSDLSRLPKETTHVLEGEVNRPGGITILVLDCLQPLKHNTHLGLDQTLEIIRKLRPKKTFLVGMSCDKFPPHHEMNAQLREKHWDVGHVEFARDGLVLHLDL